MVLSPADEKYPSELVNVEHLTDKEFERACSFIDRAYGLNMKSKRILLECRLARERARTGLSTCDEYLDLVESGRDAEATARFADLVTTHYTYFLRESSQFEFIADQAFPELERRRPNRPWNILCAGCSTGEECYSVSMLVEDYARLHRIPDVRIVGVDVSAPALKEARAGVYPASRIDRVPSHWKATYFTKQEDGCFAVNERVRRRVRFAQANLAGVESLGRTFDLVLCRNVVIYLNQKAKRHAIDLLYRHLADSCYLVLGHAEIVRDRARFAYQGHSIYRKLAEAQAS